MPASSREHRNHKKEPDQKTDRTAIVVALLTSLPVLIGALVELLKEGHALGWW